MGRKSIIRLEKGKLHRRRAGFWSGILIVSILITTFYLVINFSFGAFFHNKIGRYDCSITRSWIAKRSPEYKFSYPLAEEVGTVIYSAKDKNLQSDFFNSKEERRVMVNSPTGEITIIDLPEVNLVRGRSRSFSDYPISFSILDVKSPGGNSTKVLRIIEDFYYEQRYYYLDLTSRVLINDFERYQMVNATYLGSFYIYDNQLEYLAPDFCPALGG